MLCEPHFVQKCALRMEVCVCRGHDFLPFHRKRISSNICSTRAAHSAESTDKCKIRKSFCCTQLLRFQTFVFVRGDGRYIAAPSPSFEVRPTVAVRRQRSEASLRKCNCSQPPDARNARALYASGGFRFF